MLKSQEIFKKNILKKQKEPACGFLLLSSFYVINQNYFLLLNSSQTAFTRLMNSILF